MSSNSFGKLLTVTTFGESHGPAIGCVVDGCPPGLEIAPEEFRHDLERRATGKSRHTSARREADEVERAVHRVAPFGPIVTSQTSGGVLKRSGRMLVPSPAPTNSR